MNDAERIKGNDKFRNNGSTLMSPKAKMKNGSHWKRNNVNFYVTANGSRIPFEDRSVGIQRIAEAKRKLLSSSSSMRGRRRIELAGFATLLLSLFARWIRRNLNYLSND